MKEAIILAGGYGTRLAHIITDVQKCMAPVSGTPFLTYIFEQVLSYGFDTAVLAVSYKEDSIKNYYGGNYKNLSLVYSEEKEPLGTGGAIMQALSYCKSKCVPVINGDTYFDTDLNALCDFHNRKNSFVTLTVKKMYDFSRYGTLSFDKEGKVTDFHEKKPMKEGFINGGIYCVTNPLPDKFEKKFSFEKEILESLIYPSYAFESKGYFVDIGVPADYFSAQTRLPCETGNNVFKAAFIDRDGTINKEKNHLWKKEDFEFIPGAPEALERLRENGYLTIIITNQAGVAKGLYTEEDVETLHSFIREEIKDKTYIDAFFYCPFHEDGTVEKYRKTSRDRKPGTGMIEKAVEYFDRTGIKIDLKQSVIIGDTENDILTGVNAGIPVKILVKSGHKADTENTLADIVAEDLPEAAKILTSGDFRNNL